MKEAIQPSEIVTVWELERILLSTASTAITKFPVGINSYLLQTGDRAQGGKRRRGKVRTQKGLHLLGKPERVFTRILQSISNINHADK